MPILERFTRDRLIATPWKNGGGSTREIVRMPSNADRSDAHRRTVEARAGVLFAARGNWSANGHRFEPNTGLWWNDETASWHLAPHDSDAVLITVRILPRRPRA